MLKDKRSSYPQKELNRKPSDLQRSELKNDPESCMESVIFQTLQGRWRLYRRLTSRHISQPSGIFQGFAYLHPRPITHPLQASDGSNAVKTQMLYQEQGELLTTTGLKMTGLRSYIYQLERDLKSSNQTISCWFTKPMSTELNYLFHKLVFSSLQDNYHLAGDPYNSDKKQQLSSEQTWRAKGTAHFCAKDHYASEYQFYFRNTELDRWSIQYHVTGPQKDYDTYTVFRRYL